MQWLLRLVLIELPDKIRLLWKNLVFLKDGKNSFVTRISEIRQNLSRILSVTLMTRSDFTPTLLATFEQIEKKSSKSERKCLRKRGTPV